MKIKLTEEEERTIARKKAKGAVWKAKRQWNIRRRLGDLAASDEERERLVVCSSLR